MRLSCRGSIVTGSTVVLPFGHKAVNLIHHCHHSSLSFSSYSLYHWHSLHWTCNKNRIDKRRTKQNLNHYTVLNCMYNSTASYPMYRLVRWVLSLVHPDHLINRVKMHWLHSKALVAVSMNSYYLQSNCDYRDNRLTADINDQHVAQHCYKW